MKAVMLSIRPKWVEKIANGEKTVEIRKTRPKFETPFKCYIYCTKGKPYIGCHNQYKDGVSKKVFTNHLFGTLPYFNGSIIGEFVCNFIDCYPWDGFGDCFDISDKDLNKASLTLDDIGSYGYSCNYLYGWHISDLKIYDKSKALVEFRKPELPTGLWYEDDIITRAPQQWCYVEEVE